MSFLVPSPLSKGPQFSPSSTSSGSREGTEELAFWVFPFDKKTKFHHESKPCSRHQLCKTTLYRVLINVVQVSWMQDQATKDPLEGFHVKLLRCINWMCHYHYLGLLVRLHVCPRGAKSEAIMSSFWSIDCDGFFPSSHTNSCTTFTSPFLILVL